MTPMQRRVLITIMNLIAEKGYSPTIREVAGEIGIAPSTTCFHLDQLEAKGLLERQPGRRRTMRPVRVNPKIIEANSPGHFAQAWHKNRWG